jgi:hypothetical protein
MEWRGWHHAADDRFRGKRRAARIVFEWRATMKKLWQGGACVGLLVLAVALLMWQSGRQTALGGTGSEFQPVGPQHYSVVLTEGHNLLVTDNATNKLFFYTTDKDAPVGSPLKLRASLDLTKVGGEELKITPHNLEKFEPKKK